jgi:hypothetical protein
MKLIQIDFDHTLIGQDGIVVRYRDGGHPYKVLWEKDWAVVVSISNRPDTYVHQMNGQWGVHGETEKDLLMYRTVKVMTVDEFYDECDVNDPWMTFRQFAHKLAAAVKAGEVEISDING